MGSLLLFLPFGVITQHKNEYDEMNAVKRLESDVNCPIMNKMTWLFVYF